MPSVSLGEDERQSEILSTKSKGESFTRRKTTNDYVHQTKLNFRTENHKEVLSTTSNAAAARLKQTFNSFRAVHSRDFQSSQKYLK